MTVPQAIETVVRNLGDNFDLELHAEQGANGYMFKGKNIILDQDVMVKFYDWSNEKRAHQEPLMMKNIEHTNILKVLHAGFGDNDWAYFVTPFMKDGTLDKVMQEKSISQRDAALLLIKIAAGVCEMHGKHLLHRDLKPANIFMDGQKPVVGDFGSILFAPNISDEIESKSKHSILYRPPEAVVGDVYSVKGDVYQLGIVLYQLLGGWLPYEESAWLSVGESKIYQQLPYPDSTIYADSCICAKIIKGKIINAKSVEPYVANSLSRVFKKCCQVKPEDRYGSVSEVIAALNNILPKLNEWKREKDGRYHLQTATSELRINNKNLAVEQKKAGGTWRSKHKYAGLSSVKEVIAAVESDL